MQKRIDNTLELRSDCALGCSTLPLESIIAPFFAFVKPQGQQWMHGLTNLGLKMHQDLQNHLGTRHVYIFITSKDLWGLSFMKFHIKHSRTNFNVQIQPINGPWFFMFYLYR